MEQTEKFYKIKDNQPAYFLTAHRKKIFGAALLVLPFLVATSIINWFLYGFYGYYDYEISVQLVYSLPAYLLHFLAFVIFFTLLNGMLKVIHSRPKTKFSYAAAFSEGKPAMRFLWLPVFSILSVWVLFTFISAFLATAVVVLFIPLVYIAAFHRIDLRSAGERMRDYLSHPDFKKQLPSLFIACLIGLAVYIVTAEFLRFFSFASGWYVSVIIVNILIWLVKLWALGFWYAYTGHFYALHTGFDNSYVAKKSNHRPERKRKTKDESKLSDADTADIHERSDKRDDKAGSRKDKSNPDYNRFEHWDDEEVKF